MPIGPQGTKPIPNSAEDLNEIDSALSEFEVHGGRMNAEQRKVVEA